MKLQKQYLELHERYGNSDEVSVTLDDIAALLGCTHRNAGNLISRMSELAWVRWSASRGRGNRSTLEFLAKPEEIARQIVLRTVGQKELLASIGQIRSYSGTPEVRERLEEAIFALFGFHSEIRNQRRIDLLRLPLRQAFVTLDPVQMNLLAESFVVSHVFDTLISKDANQSLKPGLAHAWEYDETRTRITFYLRKGVYFHNGREFSSEDVVHTIERLLRATNRTLYRSVFKQVKRAFAIDRFTVQIDLHERNELFLPFLSTSRGAIVPGGHGFQGEDPLPFKPIGTGPFKVVQMDEHLCVLEAYASYYRERALLDRVEIWVLPPEQSAQHDESEMFRVIHNPRTSSDSRHTWIHHGSDAKVRKFITFNTEKAGPLTSSAYRSALVNVLKNQDSDSGFGDFKRSDPPLVLSTIPPYEQDAGEVEEKLLRQGIPIQLQIVSPEQFKGAVRLESDLLFFSLIRDQDEQLRLYDLYQSMAEHLAPHVKVDIDQVLKRITKETQSENRMRLFEKLEQRLLHDHLLTIWSEQPIRSAFHPSVRGVTFNSQGWVDLRKLWFKSGSD